MRRIRGFLFIVVLLLFVEALCRLHLLDPVYFPPPSLVAIELIRLMGTNIIWAHIGHTVLRTAVGYCCAMAIAIPVGLLVGEFKLLRDLLEPLIEMLRPMPSAAVIPVAILLFGIDDQMKISVIIFGSLWPTIVSTVDGVRGVDALLIDTGRLMQLTKIQSMTTVILPAALPIIMTGMRISLAIALILAVTAEMIAGTNGLGYFILDTQRSFAFKEMFAGIVVVGMLGYIVSRGFTWAEGRVLFWYYAPRARSEARAN